MKESSIDSIITDPPYGINIDRKNWDKSLPDQRIWEECFRVLKPGGHIMAFASARLYHRLAVNIEDSGFDTFNMLAWVYGSGFPKGKNLSKEFDREIEIPKPDDAFRSYLRAAIKRSPYKIVQLEKICGTKGTFNHFLGKSQPLYPSLAIWKNLKELLKLDSTYDAFFEDLEAKRTLLKKRKSAASGSHLRGLSKKSNQSFEPQSDLAKKWDGWRYGAQSVRPAFEPIYFGQKPPMRPVTENVKAWELGALNIEGCKLVGRDGRTRELSSLIVEDVELLKLFQKKIPQGILDTVSELSDSKIFCTPKPPRKEREGLSHPTQKPVELMRRLVRLTTPQGGTCLDPFMGSGSTGVACLKEGINFIGIERDESYFEQAEARLRANQWQQKAA